MYASAVGVRQAFYAELSRVCWRAERARKFMKRIAYPRTWSGGQESNLRSLAGLPCVRFRGGGAPGAALFATFGTLQHGLYGCQEGAAMAAPPAV